MSESIVPSLRRGRENILPRADALGELNASADYAVHITAPPQKYMTLYFDQTRPLARQEAQGVPAALAGYYAGSTARGHGYLVELTLDGRGLVEYEGERCGVQKGHICFINCALGYQLRCDPETGNWRKFYAYLSGPCVNAYFNAFRAANGGKCRCTAEENSPVRQRFEALIRLYAETRIVRFQEVRAATAICELLNDCVDAASEQAARTRTPGVVQEVMRYLTEHYHERITLDDLSARFAVEKCHLQKLFTRYNGLSPNEYLAATRMRRAKELLGAGTLSIAEVGEAVGIENASYFIKQFHRREGMTPAQYRRLLQSENGRAE